MKAFKSIINYLSASLVAHGSYFILIPLIIGFLGEKAFADIELFNVFSNLFFQILSLNVCVSVTKYMYDSKNSDDYREFTSNIYLFGILVALFSVVFSILIIIIKPSFWKLNDELTALLPLSIFFLFSNSWIQNFYTTLKKVTKFRNYQFLVGVIKIISILLIIFFLNWSSALGKIFLEFLLLVSLTIFFIRSEKIIFKLERFKSDLLKAIKFSSPLIIYVIINNLLNYSDQIFISNLFDKQSLAIYSIGYRIGMIILIFYVSISQYFSINIYDNFYDQKNTNNKTIFLILLLLLFTISLVIIGPFYIEISTQFLPNQMATAKKINGIIILSYFINSIFLIYSRELFYRGKTFTISILVTLTAIVNVILNFILLEENGIVMAAYTTLFSYMFLAFLSIFLMLRNNFIKNIKIILFYLVSVVIVSIFLLFNTCT